MKIEKHFVYITKNFIARKLFLCRICNRKCIPSNFRTFKAEYKIATSYICMYCTKSYVTSKSLYYSDTINVVFKNKFEVLE